MEVKDVFLRTAHNYDRDAASDEAGLSCPPEEGVTQQQFAEECDINTIVRRFGLTGELPGDFKAPQYGDFTDVGDYQTALNSVLRAQEEFMSLPGEIRARFQNDPQQLLLFVHDEKNREEAQKLGLLKAVEKVVAVVQPVNPVAT